MAPQAKTVKVILKRNELKRMRDIVAGCNRLVETSQLVLEAQIVQTAAADNLNIALFGKPAKNPAEQLISEKVRLAELFSEASGLDDDTGYFVVHQSHLDVSDIFCQPLPFTVKFVTDDKRLQGSRKFGGLIWADLNTGIFILAHGHEDPDGLHDWAYAVAIDSNGSTEQAAPIDGPSYDGNYTMHADYLSERLIQAGSHSA